MVCMYCASSTQVINSRLQKRSNSVWRRRKCTQCHAVFTSQEVAQYESAWRVQSAGGLQPFSRDKLLLSIYESVRHRLGALSDASALTDTVMNTLRTSGSTGLFEPNHITVAVHTVLSNFDDLAAAHYRAHHRES